MSSHSNIQSTTSNSTLHSISTSPSTFGPSTSKLSPEVRGAGGPSSRPLSSISFTSENDSPVASNEHLARAFKERNPSNSATHKSSFSTLKGRFGTLTKGSGSSNGTSSPNGRTEFSNQTTRSHPNPLPPPSSYSYSQSPPNLNPNRKGILSAPTRSLAEQLNELAVANGDGLLSDEEYRLLRTSLFERLEKGEKEVPTESAIKGGGGGRIMGRDDVFTKDAILRARHSHADLLGGSSRNDAFGGGGGASSLRDGSTRSMRSSTSNMASLFRRATGKVSKSSVEVDDDEGGNQFNDPTSPGKRPNTTGSLHGTPQNYQTRSRTPGGSSSFGEKDSLSGNQKPGSFTSSFSRFKNGESSKAKAELMEKHISGARSARSLQATMTSGNSGKGKTSTSLLSANGMLVDQEYSYLWKW